MWVSRSPWDVHPNEGGCGGTLLRDHLAPRWAPLTRSFPKALGVAENTDYRWRNQFGGIKADEMKRLKDLEKENARLKALVAELSLDKAILREAARGNS